VSVLADPGTEHRTARVGVEVLVDEGGVQQVHEVGLGDAGGQVAHVKLAVDFGRLCVLHRLEVAHVVVFGRAVREAGVASASAATTASAPVKVAHITSCSSTPPRALPAKAVLGQLWWTDNPSQSIWSKAGGTRQRTRRLL